MTDEEEKRQERTPRIPLQLAAPHRARLALAARRTALPRQLLAAIASRRRQTG